ncbi:MAG: hypothetical protein ACK4LQ_02135 [Pararhodobacter sp.]
MMTIILHITAGLMWFSVIIMAIGLGGAPRVEGAWLVALMMMTLAAAAFTLQVIA